MHLPKLPAESVLDQYSVFFEEKMPNKKAMSHKLYMHVCITPQHGIKYGLYQRRYDM